MRVGIIGAGGAGSMAAWRCAQAGHDVVLFEQFTLDHDLGSSYGDSRIVRRVYADPFYTDLMARAYDLWDEFQAASPEEVFRRAGGVFVGPRDHPELIAAQRALETSRVPYELLDSSVCADRFPAFRIRRDEIALYEPSMGYARASPCVRAAARLARERGANIHEQTSVRDFLSEATGTGVRILLDGGEVTSVDRAIVCAGAWSGPLLAQFGVSLPLTVTRQIYAHFPVPDTNDYAPSRFPVWIDADSYDYGFPRLGSESGVKLASHRPGTVVTPDHVDRVFVETDIVPLARTAQSRIVEVGTAPLSMKVCLYSNTPDEDFIVDTIPHIPDTLVISACSGHGFKFTPLLGQIAADFAATGQVPPGLERFRLARFFSLAGNRAVHGELPCL